MALITTSEVKDKWPDWDRFVNAIESTKTDDDLLQLAIDDAEVEFKEWIPEITDATINEALTRHLLHIVKKNVFDEIHGDTEWSEKPLILKDYEASIAMLERYRNGEFPVPMPEGEEDEKRFEMMSKERRFDEWFHTDQNL